MIWLYRLCFVPALLLLLPHYLRRMWKRGGYGKDFRHRIGFIKEKARRSPQSKRVWVQAVSVGELLAAGPLLRALANEPNVETFLTTTTSTGYALARKRYAGTVSAAGLFPLDFCPCSRMAWKRIRPDLAILMEGELWPEHLRQAQQRSAPVLLVNARLSDRSFRRCRRFSVLAKPLLLDPLAKVLASSRQDYQRLLSLGLPKEKAVLTGNLKCAVTIEPRLTAAQIDDLRREMSFKASGSGFTPVILGSSTWPGEEEALLEALRRVRKRGLDCRLLLVPRHAERRRELKTWLKKQKLPCHFRSGKKQAPHSAIVYVADTTGELALLTQAADLVFVGKSLPPNEGGQTPIEAAALGKPLLFGPNMGNFREIAREIAEAGGACVAEDAKALAALIEDLLMDPGRRERMSSACLKWHQTHRGALNKTLAQIRQYL